LDTEKISFRSVQMIKFCIEKNPIEKTVERKKIILA